MEDNLELEMIDEPHLPVGDNSLPPVIREIVGNAPQNRKLPAFVASLAPLCALATRVRLKYFYDTRPSALLLQVIIEGNQSVGKSFAADIERLIMDSTLRERDTEQRRLEQEYREKRRRRRANDRLEDEPRTTIRVIPATISKTVLTRRTDFHERVLGGMLTFWMFAEELAQVTDAGRQGYSNLRTIMRTAYDLGSRFGMDFASDNSYSAIVDINICSMFCTTPAALDDYMDNQAVEGGNITRCIPCRLNDSIGEDGAMFVPYSTMQLKLIGDILQSIMNDTYAPDGTLMPEIALDMSWLDLTVRDWCRQKGHEATLTGSTALDVFRKRSSVSAFRIAALCYYLYGKEGVTSQDERRERCRDIYLFMAEYVLQGLLSRWGRRFEELNIKRNIQNVFRRRRGIFELLGQEFTRDELKNIVSQRELTTPARVFIHKWKQAGDITPIDGDRFRKSECYLQAA